MIVVDASVLVKVLLREVDAETAIDFLLAASEPFAAPDLLMIEVASAIVRNANERTRPVGEAREILGEWIVLLEGPAIERYRMTPEDISRAADLAITLGHPIRDCLYLALAEQLDCDFVTADRKFHAKARVDHPRVRLLEGLAR